MTIPILVEPIPTGFRASTGGPLDLYAEAPSIAEAFTAIQSQIDCRFEKGAVLVPHWIPVPKSPIPLLPLAENPLFDSWLREVEQFREEKEAQDQAIYE